MYERRAETRIQANFSVQVQTLAGTCLDLSASGMRLQTEWSLPVGLRIELTLTGLGEGDEQVTARVTHWYSGEGEVGVRFVQIDRTAFSQIRDFLSEHDATSREETSHERLRLHGVTDTVPVDVDFFTAPTFDDLWGPSTYAEPTFGR